MAAAAAAGAIATVLSACLLGLRMNLQRSPLHQNGMEQLLPAMLLLLLLLRVVAAAVLAPTLAAATAATEEAEVVAAVVVVVVAATAVTAAAKRRAQLHSLLPRQAAFSSLRCQGKRLPSIQPP